MSAILDLLKKCGNEFDECFTVVDLEKEDTPLIYINHHFTQITGFGKLESLGRNCRFLQGVASDRETTKELKRSIKEHKSCWFDLINYKKDGTPFWNRLVLIPIEHDVFGIRYYIGIQSDVTEKKEKELKMSLSSMIEKEIPTNEIEHFVSNPLQEIISNIRSLQYFNDENNEEIENTKKLIQEKIKEIVNYIRNI